MKQFARFAIVVGLLSVVASTALRAEDIFALTNNGNLVRFDSDSPGTIISTVAITGTVEGASEGLVSIDFRPNTGQLWGLSDKSRVYTVNTATGVVTQVGSAQFAPALAVPLSGIDFNPTVDRIRLCGAS